MGMNFPNSPSVGAIYAPGGGLPVYKWDGTKWGATTAYTDGSVRWDSAQSLTAAQQAQARQNIAAAPFDAMAYSGMQINGSCEISQERGNTSFALVNGTGAYVSDGWRAQFGAAATLAVSCFPLDTNAPPGFQFNTAVLASTGLASLAANDYVILQHFIEGWRMARLAWGSANAQPITISFWVMTNVTGTFAVAIRNGATNRSYVADVVVPTALVWQWVMLTIPGDTTGTWPKDNTRGMEIDFCCGAGSALKVATPSTWMAAGNLATASTTNFVNAAGNGIRVTGLVVLPGTQAPTAAQSPFVMRTLPQELEICKRYSRWVPFNMYFLATQPEQIITSVTLTPEMRIAPAMSAITIDPTFTGTPPTAVNNAANQFLWTTTNSAAQQLTAAAAGGCYVYGFRSFADARL